MRTLEWYIDEARNRNGFTSDRRLSDEIKRYSNCVTAWRAAKTFPTDEHMVTLAQLAGADVHAALIELAYWRAKGATKLLWKQIFEDYNRE